MATNTLPPGVEMDRRASCLEHERQIDSIAAETSKHGAWFKVFGASIGLVSTIAFMLGSSINQKLDSIALILTESKVMAMKHEVEIKTLQNDVDEINKRHQYKDRNGIGVQRR